MNLAWKQIIIAFVLGGIVGVIGVQGRNFYCMHRHWKPGEFQARLLQKFNSKLQLTPGQRTQVAAILETKRQKIDSLRAEFRPRFEEIRNSASAEIRQLLTPEQQVKFDVMKEKWQRKAKQCGWMGNKEESK